MSRKIMSRESDESAAVAPDEVSPEQAADVAHLESMIQPDESQGPGPGQGQGEPEAVNPAESLAGFMTVAAMVAGRIGYERAAGVWAPDVCREFAARAVPVLEKYPWGQKALAFLRDGSGVEEMALAVYAVPVALATWEAAKLDREAMRPKRKPEAPEAGEVYEAGGVAMEAAEAPAGAGPDPLRGGA